MTFKQWLWSTNFWILVAPATILFTSLMVYEEIITPIRENRKPNKLDAITAVTALPMILLFVWIVTR